MTLCLFRVIIKKKENSAFTNLKPFSFWTDSPSLMLLKHSAIEYESMSNIIK